MQTCRDGDVFVDPRCVCNGRDLHWQEVVIPEASALSFSPSKGLLIDAEDICCQLHLFGPQEIEFVKIEFIILFLGESGAWSEWGGMCWQ